MTEKERQQAAIRQAEREITDILRRLETETGRAVVSVDILDRGFFTIGAQLERYVSIGAGGFPEDNWVRL